MASYEHVECLEKIAVSGLDVSLLKLESSPHGSRVVDGRVQIGLSVLGSALREPARSPHKRYLVWGDQRYPKSGDWSQQSPICRRDYQRPCAFVSAYLL